jgi:cyclic-di-GMP phosphodiesterase TipF (flagellum assembly factor)
VVEESGLIGTLDNLLLFRCIQTIRRLGPRRPGIKFFCNISPASLEDDEFFPQFIDFMLNNAELTDRLVFEFAESDILRQSPDIRRRLNILGQRGFAFSMDQVSDVRFNFPDLADRFIRFVKLDADMLMTQSIDLQPEDLKEALQRYGIELIVEKIENEKTVLDVLDLGVTYGQGYLFGEPRLSREPGEAAPL